MLPTGPADSDTGPPDSDTGPPDVSGSAGRDQLVTVGLIGKAHGLRGEVAVQPWTDDPQQRFAPGTVFTTQPKPGERERATAAPELTVTTARAQSGRWVVAFAELTDRGAAEALRGTRLLLPATVRPVIDDPDQFYDTDLVGLVVRDRDGAVIGAVRDVVHGPAGDLLAVEQDGREHLVPFVRAIVPTVDLAEGFLVVDAPEGLFEL